MSIEEALAHTNLNFLGPFCSAFAPADDFNTQGWVERALSPSANGGEMPGNYLFDQEILASPPPAGPNRGQRKHSVGQTKTEAAKVAGVKFAH